MPTLTHDSRFFGFELSTLVRDWSAAWQRMRRWPLFAWLTPEVPVRLLEANGGESLWLASETLRPVPSGSTRQAHFTAIRLPEDLVLARSLRVPALSDAQAADAIALDVASASPFPVEDTLWGHALLPADDGQRRIEAALASRRQVQQHLDNVARDDSRSGIAGMGDVPEVWAVPGDGPPIVISGFGEDRRAQKIAKGRRLRLGLLALAALLALGVAVTPTAQLRLRAMRADDALNALSQRAAPLQAKREMLVNAAERLSALRAILGERIDPLRVLDVVTQALPDDTWLQSLQIEGRKVVIAGQTRNAAALMQTIGNRPGLRDVKAPSAAYRQPGAALESFSIEFTLEPKAFENAAAAPAGSAAPADRSPVAANAFRP